METSAQEGVVDAPRLEQEVICLPRRLSSCRSRARSLSMGSWSGGLAVAAGDRARTCAALRPGDFRTEQKGRRINVLLTRRPLPFSRVTRSALQSGLWTPRWTPELLSVFPESRVCRVRRQAALRRIAGIISASNAEFLWQSLAKGAIIYALLAEIGPCTSGKRAAGPH
jgi:hypothetical protein